MKNKRSVLKNLLIGVFGACLLAVSGWLTGALGDGNVKNGLIMKNWAKMPAWRFELSMILAAVGSMALSVGMTSMSYIIKLIRRRKVLFDSKVSTVFSFGALTTSVASFFIVVIYNILPLLYKSLYESTLMEADLIDVVEGIFYYVAIPFYFFFAISIIAVSFGFIYFILEGRMKVNKVYILLNPLAFLGIGKLLKYVSIYHVADFSTGMIGLGYAMMLFGTLSFAVKIPGKKRAVTRR